MTFLDHLERESRPSPAMYCDVVMMQLATVDDVALAAAHRLADEDHGWLVGARSPDGGPRSDRRGTFATTSSRCYDAMMRTTVDLPTDLHELARQLAHQEGRSMSAVITDLIRLGLQRDDPRPAASSRRGLPSVSVGRPVTAEDVRSLEDDA